MAMYKVLINRCADPNRAQLIAEEIARWSGSTPDVVKNAVMQKPVCIRREASADEAMQLKQQFEAVGAQIQIVPLNGAPPLDVEGSQASAMTGSDTQAWDEDEDMEPGRLRSDEEYAQMLRSRPDIFKVEKETKVRNIQIVCIIIGLLLGSYITWILEIPEIATDFIEKLPEERAIKLTEMTKIEEEIEKQKPIEETEKKELKPAKAKGSGGNTGGGGDPRARVVKRGVLGIISGKVKGKSVASADIFGKGGFASNIDAVISGVGGLTTGADGGSGRKGATGIGYGVGYGSGYGGGSSSGVSDLLGSLMGGDGGSVELKKRGTLEISESKFIGGAALTGGRSKASIARVVMQNIASLRYAYNKRLREKPGLKGKITVKFAIDEFGKVIFCEVVNSNMNDSELENTVVSKIRRWAFGKIDKAGDVTEVVYPFSFAQ